MSKKDKKELIAIIVASGLMLAGLALLYINEIASVILVALSAGIFLFFDRFIK